MIELKVVSRIILDLAYKSPNCRIRPVEGLFLVKLGIELYLHILAQDSGVDAFCLSFFS